MGERERAEERRNPNLLALQKLENGEKTEEEEGSSSPNTSTHAPNGQKQQPNPAARAVNGQIQQPDHLPEIPAQVGKNSNECTFDCWRG